MKFFIYKLLYLTITFLVIADIQAMTQPEPKPAPELPKDILGLIAPYVISSSSLAEAGKEIRKLREINMNFRDFVQSPDRFNKIIDFLVDQDKKHATKKHPARKRAGIVALINVPESVSWFLNPKNKVEVEDFLEAYIEQPYDYLSVPQKFLWWVYNNAHHLSPHIKEKLYKHLMGIHEEESKEEYPIEHSIYSY